MVFVDAAHLGMPFHVGVNPGGVGDRFADVLPDDLRGIGKVDRIAHRLAHLRIAVKARQAPDFTELCPGNGDIRTVELVELPDDLSGKLDMGDLILSDGNQIRIDEGDIGGLADRISQEPIGEILVAVVGRFRLDRRIVPQLIDGDDHRVEDGQLGDRGDLGLLNKCYLFRIEPY